MITFSNPVANGDVMVYENNVMIGLLTHEQTTGGTKASEFKWLQLQRPNREMLSADDLINIAQKLYEMNTHET